MFNSTEIHRIGTIGRDDKGAFYGYIVRITLAETNIEGTGVMMNLGDYLVKRENYLY